MYDSNEPGFDPGPCDEPSDFQSVLDALDIPEDQREQLEDLWASREMDIARMQREHARQVRDDNKVFIGDLSDGLPDTEQSAEMIGQMLVDNQDAYLRETLDEETYWERKQMGTI